MNKKLQMQDDSDSSKDTESGDYILNKITSKSKGLKATLKAKYLLYKLEKSFYNKKFML